METHRKDLLYRGTETQSESRFGQCYEMFQFSTSTLKRESRRNDHTTHSTQILASVIICQYSSAYVNIHSPICISRYMNITCVCVWVMCKIFSCVDSYVHETDTRISQNYDMMQCMQVMSLRDHIQFLRFHHKLQFSEYVIPRTKPARLLPLHTLRTVDQRKKTDPEHYMRSPQSNSVISRNAINS